MAQSFKAAFAAARKEKGAGKTFTWNGKSYSTNRADDKPAKGKGGLTASARPMPNPRLSRESEVRAKNSTKRPPTPVKAKAPVKGDEPARKVTKGSSILAAIKSAFTGGGGLSDKKKK